jgi:hypothetical protein
MKRGSATEHKRYMQKSPPSSRQRCSCGCKTRQTHTGMANGVALMGGCDFYVRRWVRDGSQVRKVK